jgi:Flp pilus assembly secretin CpaC
MSIWSKRHTCAVFVFRSLAIGVLSYPVAVMAEPVVGVAEQTDGIAVNVDQAKLVKLPARIATIVVGNPLIADVTMQPGGMIVVTGKGYGATNFIAMDRAGAIVADRVIQVSGPTDKVVTVYRGIERESYSCMPICQRRVTLGDSEGYFKSTIEQAGSLNTQATGASAAAKGN